MSNCIRKEGEKMIIVDRITMTTSIDKEDVPEGMEPNEAVLAGISKTFIGQAIHSQGFEVDECFVDSDDGDVYYVNVEFCFVGSKKEKSEDEEPQYCA
jgi:hypothetical protein